MTFNATVADNEAVVDDVDDDDADGMTMFMMMTTMMLFLINPFVSLCFVLFDFLLDATFLS